MRTEFDDKTIRYMEMIQGVITRMGTNSFSLKGWTVTLVAGILALSSTVIGGKYIYMALMPVLFFWLLDTFYLQLARKYRALFDYIRTLDDSVIDFELNPSVFVNRICDRKHVQYWRCLISKTEFWFYVPVGAVVFLFVIGII